MLVTMIAILILIIAYLLLIMPRMSRKSEMEAYQGVEWAHRGIHCVERGVPENSMKAFEAAIKEGVGIELDVHVTKDDKIVVFHDETLDRMCGKKGRIKDLTYPELRKYSLGGTTERIPLLEDVLRLVNGQVPLLIEIKSFTKDTHVCEQLDKVMKGYQGAYLVQSFNCVMLQWYKKHCPNVLRGQLSSNLTRRSREANWFFRFAVQFLLSDIVSKPDFISYRWEDTSNLSVQIVKHLYQAPVAVWTIRSGKTMAQVRTLYHMYIYEQE
jgi:glycerophosphoryl diester phosphodiesterase